MSLLLVGCGGGGGSTTGTPVVGNEQQVGNMLISSKGATPAVVTGGSNSDISVTSLSGSDFNSVRLLGSKDLASTRIAFWVEGRICLCDPSGGNVEIIPMKPLPVGHTTIAFSPDGTKIVFSGSGGIGFAQLYTMNVDGTGFKRLTNGLANTLNPTWSANNLIAYSQFDSNNTPHIYVMNGDGTSPRRITSTTSYDFQPSISRDGSKIVYAHRVTDTNSEITIIDVTGSNRRTLVSSGDLNTQPSFSPDGQSVLFKREAGNADAIIETSASSYEGEPEETQASLELPIYAPDGRSFGYTLEGGNGFEVRTWDYANRVGNIIAHGSFAGWSNFPVTRTLVGSGGTLGSGAGAILLSQDSHDVRSVVAVDAVTRTSVQSTIQSSGGSQIAKVTGGGGIKTVYYINGIRNSRLTLTAGSTNFDGVLVSFSSQTGYVINLVPFNKMAAASNAKSNEYSGQFLGVYDAKGQRIGGPGTKLQFDSTGNAKAW